MIYTLQASCALALLYSIYWLFLSRTGHHRLNRFVLIGIAVISLLLPLTTSMMPELMPTPNLTADGSVYITEPPSIFTATQQLLQPISPATTLSPATILEYIYLFGLAIGLTRIVAPLTKLIMLIRKNPTRREKGYTLVQLSEPTPPFSFFRYIFIGSNDYSEAQQRNILLHEQIHIQQHHTLDILFMELFTALFWFHPLAWQLNRQTKLNLEYLADNQLIKTGVDQKEYQYHLLQLTLGPSLSRMANYFNQSHLQKRIIMINSTTRRTSIWKYTLFLPALIACCFFFATANAQSATDNADIYLVIRPTISESVIQRAQSELAADGIDFSLTNLSYTGDHQLSGLHLTISKNGQTLEDLTLSPSGQPFTEPLVFYWLRSKNGNPTLTRGYPGNIDHQRLKLMQNLTGYLRNNPVSKQMELHGSARIGD